MLSNIIWESKRGYLGLAPTQPTYDVMLIDDHLYKIHHVIVHTFAMGDVEDPDLYAAEPLLQWQKSEMGKFVMEKAVESPVWHRAADPMNYGYSYKITAKLKGPDYTFWQLKWGDQVDKLNSR